MERSLHPQLAKRIRRVDAAGAVRMDNQDAAQFIALTRNRAGTPPPANQQKDVTILDVFRNAATVKVVANAWIDYLHLTKTDDGWRIVNVLWEMKDPRPAQAPAAPPALLPEDVSVPMSDIGGRPMIEVGINGNGPFRMIVDTGANRTVLSADLVAELDLQLLRLEAIKETVPTYNGTVRVGVDVVMSNTWALLKRLASADGHAEAVETAGTLSYQACDDKVCYLPASLPLTWQLTTHLPDRERVRK